MTLFELSISAIESILSASDYIIKHTSKSTIIYCKHTPNTKLKVSRELIIMLLKDNKNYKSYTLFTRAYNKYKDKETIFAQRMTKHSLDMINRIIYIKAVKYLFIELKNKQLITTTCE